MQIYNKKTTKHFRKDLRKNQTESEKIIWQEVRNKKLLGYKFFRQYGIGNYIVDFYCPEKRLVVEIDGLHHLKDEYAKKDRERDRFLQSLGGTVLRFLNNDIYYELDKVLNVIVQTLQKQ